MRALPGVSTAALSSTFPLGAAPANRTFDVVGRRTAQGRQQPTADMRFVTSQYFATINHPVIRGRTFERGDRVERPLVAVVNQTLARNHFADEDPIGQLLLVPRSIPMILDIPLYSMNRPRPGRSLLPRVRR